MTFVPLPSGWFRAIGWISLALTSVPGAGASGQGVVSAPIRNVAYEVTADSASVAHNQLGVTMRFDVSSRDAVILSLPAWSPGHYTLLWFARRMSAMRIAQDDSALVWRMRDFQTWEIRPRHAGRIDVSFRYLADTIDRAVAWTRPNFSFFNGTNVFLYPVGRPFSWPAQVTIRTDPGWRVATSMDPGAQAQTFVSSNYHDLVDRPFFVGRFDLDSTRVSDRWIRLATYPVGAVAGTRKTRLLDWVRRFLPQEVAVFGEAPFKRYTIFQVSDSIVNGGGLEHQDSQLDEVPTGSLDAVGPSLYSHELFHAWNVKRLRPADLVPYRYDDAQPSRWLWVSEGVTDYYAELVLARAGVITDTAFAAAMANDAAEVMSSPPVAAADASLQPWIAPTDGTGSIYYPKGAAIGFLLDILIRDASDGRHSLDDVMRDLYLSTYKQGRGFTADEWWRAVSRAANGKSFAEFARRYVDGREPLPFDSVLALAALATSRETVREPRMGLSTITDSAGVRVAALVSGGAAAASGMLAGDQIVSLGDVPVTNNGSFDAFRARYAGTALATIPAVVRRQGREVTLTLPIRLAQREIFRIRPLAQPTARATSLYRALLAPRQPGA